MKATTVLLLDDNPAHRQLTRRALEKMSRPFNVVEADSLAAARAALTQSGATIPALGIIDLHLGDGRGSDFIRELRTDTRYDEMILMILSTSGLQTDIDECMAAGATKYVVKSDDIRTFTKQISDVITSLLQSP